MQHPYEHGTFRAADGLRLYFQHWRAQGTTRATLVLAHGYSDHTERFNAVATQLTDLGYDIFGFDFRGHGRSEGPRGHCDRFDDFVRDLERGIDTSAERSPGLPQVILGSSHGGLVTLSLISQPERVSSRVRAAILVSPFLGSAIRVPGYKVALARIMSRFFPTFSLPHGLKGSSGTRNEAVARSYDTDPLVHRVASARCFTEMTAVQRELPGRVGRIELPTLWLIAGDDRIVDTAQTRRVFTLAGGPKTMKDYPGKLHDLWTEARRDVVHDLDAYIRSLLNIGAPSHQNGRVLDAVARDANERAT